MPSRRQLAGGSGAPAAIPRQEAAVQVGRRQRWREEGRGRGRRRRRFGPRQAEEQQRGQGRPEVRQSFESLSLTLPVESLGSYFMLLSILLSDPRNDMSI